MIARMIVVTLPASTSLDTTRFARLIFDFPEENTE